LNNHGRALYLYDELLRRSLDEATRGLVEDRRRSARRALDRQTSAA